MKVEHKRSIITDLSSDNVIFERFEKEMPKVMYWINKKKHDIQPAYFPDKPLKYCNQQTLVFEEYIADGVIHWKNPVNEDTWGVAIFHKRTMPWFIIRIPFYYWITVGSIGFMIETNIGTASNMHSVITTFSSHAMLRYRERLHLNCSGFDLITHLLGSTHQNVPRIYERNGRETMEIICSDGVFRAPINGRYVFTIKTFLAWEELNRKDYKDARELWDAYQSIFSK